MTPSFMNDSDNREALVQVFANTTESLTNVDECSFCGEYQEIKSVANFSKISEIELNLVEADYLLLFLFLFLKIEIRKLFTKY